MSTLPSETGRSVSTPSNSKTRFSVWCKSNIPPRPFCRGYMSFCCSALLWIQGLSLQSFSSFCLLSLFRHVKGRVLVALADGTLAIFHRSEGVCILTVASCWCDCLQMLLSVVVASLHCVFVPRRPVGPVQLSPHGPRPASSLHPLHGGRPR